MEDAPEIHVVAGERTVAHGYICKPCLEFIMEELADLRRQFTELVEAGVSRADANRLMCERIDGGATS